MEKMENLHQNPKQRAEADILTLKPTCPYAGWPD